MINKKIINDLINNYNLPDAHVRYLAKLLANKSTILPGWNNSFLSKLMPIDTIIDVGVLDGTLSLYKAFPKSRLILIEPLPEKELKCQEIISQHQGGGEYHIVAAGVRDGEVSFKRLVDDPRRSSVLSSYITPDAKTEEFFVSLRRLDSLLTCESLGNTLLKIDTEGYELDVLMGAENLFPKIKFIITETSVRERHVDSYRFNDISSFLNKFNFKLFDALTVTRSKPLLPGASIIDALWKNEGIDL